MSFLKLSFEGVNQLYQDYLAWVAGNYDEAGRHINKNILDNCWCFSGAPCLVGGTETLKQRTISSRQRLTESNLHNPIVMRCMSHDRLQTVSWPNYCMP